LHEIRNYAPGMDISPKVTIETYRQMDYRMSTDAPVLSHLMKQTEYSEPVVRSILQNIGFKQDKVSKPLHNLSGGEATRVSLALLFVKPSNVIILDEPTNFIDLDTIEALESFIEAYEGTVILTSHDKYFVERVADIVYRIEDGKLKIVD
ncbi:ATP-binding cassette domain-containing protein, partial [Planococcus sp. SIMBA_143]